MICADYLRRSWSDLPPDLAALILANLPLSSAARARAVCHSWRTTLASTEFLLLRQRLHPPTPPPTLLLYNHAAKISATIANGAAPWTDLPLPSAFVREWAADPIAGFVCIRTHLATSLHQFLVGRPNSNHWRPIPNPPNGATISRLWAVAADSSDRFWILLLNLQAGKASVSVFDSDSSRWTAALPAADISWSSRAEGIGGVVYVVDPGKRNVMMLDVRRGEWKTRRLELPAEMSWEAEVGGRKVEATPKLVAERRGRLVLAGVSKSGGGVAVWEEDHGARRWVELVRAPMEEGKELVEEAAEWRKAEVVSVRFAGAGDVVVLLAAGAQRALRVELGRGSWSWLLLPASVNPDLALCLLAAA